jgi:hypothetical protein
MKKFSIGLLLAQLLLLGLPLVSMAQALPDSGALFGPPNSGKCNTGSGTCIQNPLGNIDSFPKLAKALFDALLPIGVSIGVLFIVWSGFKFVWAQGNPEKLKEARTTFLYTIIGIGIFLAAWSIAEVVSKTIDALKSGTF